MSPTELRHYVNKHNIHVHDRLGLPVAGCLFPVF